MPIPIIGPGPRSQAMGQLGQSMGAGLAKRMGLAEAEQAFQAAEGDPVKLATAMARLTSVSPELSRGAGPMYQAILSASQGKQLGSLGDQQQEQAQPFPFQVDENNLPQMAETPTSLTSAGDLDVVMRGFIRPSQDQIRNEAGVAYRKSPAQFQGDPNNAIQAVVQKYDQMAKQVDDYEKRHQTLTGIQDSVKKRLNDHVQARDVKIPADTYARIEQDALASVKKDNLTEEQAMVKYGKIADEISRQYSDLEKIGKRDLILKNKESLASLRALQKEFKERGDTRNMAESLVADNGVSYPVAYSIADPIKDYPRTNNFIENLGPNFESTPGRSREKTENMVPKLAKLIADEGASPQAVFNYMKQKYYDPLILKDYLNTHKDELGLTPLQTDQLQKETGSLIPNMNDLWLNSFGGLK